MSKLELQKLIVKYNLGAGWKYGELILCDSEDSQRKFAEIAGDSDELISTTIEVVPVYAYHSIKPRVYPGTEEIKIPPGTRERPIGGKPNYLRKL